LDGQAIPPAAVDLISKGVPAHRVLTPHIPLTPKQKALVDAMAAGASKREAYLASHEPDKASSKTITMMASRAAASPNVQAALSQQQAVERLRYSQNPLQIRSFVVDSLQHLARTAQKDSDRLAALKMLGQLADVQAFETKSVVEHRSSADTKSRLAAKLQRLVIDVEAHPPASVQGGEDDPTPGEGAQSDGVLGGGPRSNNPHTQSPDFSDPPSDQEGTPYESSIIPPRGGIVGEEAPYEEEVGSHDGEGVKKKKKDRPIWEDPKRWYAETMGEVPKIEWAPREEAREEVQKRLSDELE
jgi:hypothetical protein